MDFPEPLTELIRLGVGGDDLTFSPKHSPEVYKRRGGINLVITSNELPNMRANSLQAQRRILWVQTGGFNSRFVGTDLEGELARNLPAIVSWIMKMPLEYLFLTPYLAATSMITNPEPAWCSASAFVARHRDKFVVHPSLSSPIGIQGGDPGASLYSGYQAYCTANGITTLDQIKVNSMSEVLTEVFSRTFGVQVVPKNARTGIVLYGVKYHASNTLADPPPGSFPLDVLLPLPVAILHLLDAMSNIPIPMYHIPIEFYKFLYVLKEAKCPVQYSHLITLRDSFMSGRMSHAAEVDTFKPLETDSFEQLLENCPSLVEINVSSSKDFIELHRNCAQPAKSNTETRQLVIPQQRREAIAKLVDLSELPAVPLSVLNEIRKHPLSPAEKEYFAQLWDRPFEEWMAYCNAKGSRGPELILVKSGRLRYALKPNDQPSQGDTPLSVSSEVCVDTIIQPSTQVSQAQPETLNNPNSLVKKVFVNDLNKTVQPSQDVSVKPLPDTKQVDNQRGSNKPPLQSKRPVELYPRPEVPAKLIKWLNTKDVTKAFTWKSRVMHRIAYTVCTHVAEHSYDSMNLDKLAASLGYGFTIANLEPIINKLNQQGLLDWGRKGNILPTTVGLMFLDIVPDEAKPDINQLTNNEMLNIAL